MFGHIIKLGARPAAAAAAATVAANVAQGSAHARAPPPPQGARQAVPPSVHNKIVDRDTEGWVLAEMKDQVVLFQPFDEKDVDEAANTVLALWAGGSSVSSQTTPIISEPDEDLNDGRSSSAVSDGGDDRLADAVIEAAAAANADAVAAGRAKDREELDRLMTITTRMLRRPGMQREVVMCMMEDPEVRDLMMRQCDNLDRYLLAAGIHNPQLLPPATTIEEDSGTPGATEAAGRAPAQQQGGPNLVARLVGAVAGALEHAGNALASLGDWLRRQLARTFQGEDEQRAEGAEGDDLAASGKGKGQRKADQVLGGVMVLVVAVFCVMVIRRPLVLRALVRR